MEFAKFLGQMSSFDALFFSQKVPSSVQVLFQVDKLDKLDYLKNPLLDLIFFYVSSYEFLPMLEGTF